jgi:hypothetical protein
VALSNPNKLSLIVVPSGSGKSWCLMILANYYCFIDTEATIIILTASEILKKQLKMMIGKHVNSDRVKFKWKPFKSYAKSYLLIDEADEVLKQFACKLNRAQNCSGVKVFLHSTKVICFSATSADELSSLWHNYTAKDSFRRTIESESQLSEGF